MRERFSITDGNGDEVATADSVEGARLAVETLHGEGYALPLSVLVDGKPSLGTYHDHA